MRVKGFDALAFYKSKRFQKDRPFRGKWGVFYLEQGLAHVANLIAAFYPGHRSPYKLAHGFLYAHEHYHFRADLQTLMMETIAHRHLYVPLRRALRGRRTRFVEEALANRNALNWARDSRIGLREFAEDFMDLQPNAYSRYAEPHAELAGEWLANTLDLQPPGCIPRSDITPWVAATPKDLMRKSLCPEYVVQPTRLTSWLDPAHVPPPVATVHDSSKLTKILTSRYPTLKDKWARTKKKLVEDRLRHGLNFKPWPQDGRDAYSVRVDRAVRAHLRHQGGGMWEAYDIGQHTKMGHG